MNADFVTGAVCNPVSDYPKTGYAAILCTVASGVQLGRAPETCQRRDESAIGGFKRPRNEEGPPMGKRSTKNIGSATTLEFAFECGRRGALVSEPFGDDAPYDLIIDNGKRLFKVNVKTAWPKVGAQGVFTFNGTRKVPRNSASFGPSSRSVAYEPGELDLAVTKAAGIWFFFDDPSKLTGTVTVYPDSGPDDYKWNAGKNNWAAIGLPDLPLTTARAPAQGRPNSRCSSDTDASKHRQEITVTLEGGPRLVQFQSWWAKAVTGFDPTKHCQRCLLGPSLKPAGLSVPMNVATPYAMPRAAVCLYFCGVSSDGRKHNFHAPLVYEPGQRVVLPMFGDQQFVADDARLIQITPLQPEFNGLTKAYWKCPNFQYGVQQFGYDPAISP